MFLKFFGLIFFQKNSSTIEWDLTNEPLSKLVELLQTHVSGSVQ